MQNLSSNRLLIRGAFTVTETAEINADIYIEDGKIRRIVPSSPCSSADDLAGAEPFGGGAGQDWMVIDASRFVALPGGVDPHTHFDLDVGIARASDDFYSGTLAAACGGTTTIIDHMAFGKKGCLPTDQLDVYHGLADGKAVIDYGFHGVIQSADEVVLEDLALLKSRGVSSVKGYLTYDYKLGDADVLKILRRMRELGMLFCVHAENHDIIAYLRASFAAEGKTAARYHPQSRPAECEAEAVYRACRIACLAGDAPLYIVHLSSAAGFAAFDASLKTGQKNLFAETCPQYLFLDDSCYAEKTADGADAGLKYVMSPPLRSKADVPVLWQALKDGIVSTIGTDHCPFYLSEKQRISGGDFIKSPNGAPGVEARLPLLFGEAQKGNISLRQLTDWCCTNPAKIFGLYPQKGIIREGSDADIVLFDPAKKAVLTKSMLHENCDYTPYEGLELNGLPVMTISRGEVIVRDGTPCKTAKAGRGRFLARAVAAE